MRTPLPIPPVLRVIGEVPPRELLGVIPIALGKSERNWARSAQLGGMVQAEFNLYLYANTSPERPSDEEGTERARATCNWEPRARVNDPTPMKRGLKG